MDQSTRARRRPAWRSLPSNFRLAALCCALLAGVGFTLLPAGPAQAFGVGGAEATNPFAGDAEAARQGEELFGRICQQCHNTRGHGGKCPQLVRGAWAPGGANSDALMFETISNGRPNTQMGAFSGGLSRDEIWAIVTYLRAEALRVRAAEAGGKKNDDGDLWY